MSKIVLLTRSEERNRSFIASRLKNLDLKIVSRPLLQYSEGVATPEMKKQILELDQYDHIIFISQNAVEFGLHHLRAYWPQWPSSLNWYAVGPATAGRLVQEDIEPIQPAKASTEGLLGLVQLTQVVSSKVLIVRGEGGRELLKETLIDRGAEVDYLEAYHRTFVTYHGNFCESLEAETCVLIYSGEALKRLKELVAAELARFQVVVPSRRLQTMAIELGFAKVDLASNQQDDSMLRSLLRVVSGANS